MACRSPPPRGPKPSSPLTFAPASKSSARTTKPWGSAATSTSCASSSKKPRPPAQSGDWQHAAQKWERFGLTTWSFGDLPEKIIIGERQGIPLSAWPGLQLEESGVSLRLFHSPEAARRASLGGVQRLVELAVQKDLAWLEKDLRALARLDPLRPASISSEQLQADALDNARHHVLPREPFPELTKANFDAAVELARERLRGLNMQLFERIQAILDLRNQVAARLPNANTNTTIKLKGVGQMLSNPPPPPKAYPALPADLNSLVPSNFLRVIPFEHLPHIPRYLKAMLIRCDRAALNPVKDQERARQLAPYLQAYQQLQPEARKTLAAYNELQALRWMIEEFKVSLFAQELGTAVPVSPKRLDDQVEKVRRTIG